MPAPCRYGDAAAAAGAPGGLGCPAAVPCLQDESVGLLGVASAMPMPLLPVDALRGSFGTGPESRSRSPAHGGEAGAVLS